MQFSCNLCNSVQQCAICIQFKILGSFSKGNEDDNENIVAGFLRSAHSLAHAAMRSQNLLVHSAVLTTKFFASSLWGQQRITFCIFLEVCSLKLISLVLLSENALKVNFQQHCYTGRYMCNYTIWVCFARAHFEQFGNEMLVFLSIAIHQVCLR